MPFARRARDGTGETVRAPKAQREAADICCFTHAFTADTILHNLLLAAVSQFPNACCTNGVISCIKKRHKNTSHSAFALRTTCTRGHRDENVSVYFEPRIQHAKNAITVSYLFYCVSA